MKKENKGARSSLEREQIKALEEWVNGTKKIQPMANGNYFLPDLLTAPFSETYKEMLRTYHSDEWIKSFEEYIKQRNIKKKI